MEHKAALGKKHTCMIISASETNWVDGKWQDPAQGILSQFGVGAHSSWAGAGAKNNGG